MQVGDLVKYRNRWLETIGIITSTGKMYVQVHWSTGKTTIEHYQELVLI